MYNVAIIGAGLISSGFDDIDDKRILTHAHAIVAHDKFNLCGFYDIKNFKTVEKFSQNDFYYNAYHMKKYCGYDTKKGAKFTPENVRSIRPNYGLHPRYYSDIIGKTSNKDLKFGDALRKDDITDT